MPSGLYNRAPATTAGEQMYHAFQGFYDSEGNHTNKPARENGTFTPPTLPIDWVTEPSSWAMWVARKDIVQRIDSRYPNAAWLKLETLFYGDYMNLTQLRGLLQEHQHFGAPKWVTNRDTNLKTFNKANVGSLVDMCFEFGHDYRTAVVKAERSPQLYVYLPWAYWCIFGVAVDKSSKYVSRYNGDGVLETPWSEVWMGRIRRDALKVNVAPDKILPLLPRYHPNTTAVTPEPVTTPVEPVPPTPTRQDMAALLPQQGGFYVPSQQSVRSSSFDDESI